MIGTYLASDDLAATSALGIHAMSGPCWRTIAGQCYNRRAGRLEKGGAEDIDTDLGRTPSEPPNILG